MVYSLTWMADTLRRAGLQVREVPGWQNRGHGNVGPIVGVMLHHTAGPATGDFPSQDVVVNGRPGLPGPLCNLGLTRSGVWVVVAAGLAYHAGSGYWGPAGTNGNTHTIGVEAESTGRGDWTEVQHEAYPRGVAALLLRLGLGADRAVAHKEWAPTRKIDPAGWRWGDMGGFRKDIAYWQNEIRASRTDSGGAPAPAPQDEEDFMPELENWEQRHMFDSVKSMAQGVPGRQFDGAQFTRENAWRLQADAKLEAIIGLLGQSLQGELTEAKATEIVNAAVTGQTAALAEVVSAQLTARILPELTAIMEHVLGSDNEKQAKEIVRQLGEALTRPPEVDGNPEPEQD